MPQSALRGTIAAIVSPIDGTGGPDVSLFLEVAGYLLDHGCDGLNVLGTTGEATSFTVIQRLHLMRQVSQSSLPVDKLMVGTGSSAVGDAVTLTQQAADCGFAGALVLPPFYYKNVSDDGIVRYIDAIVAETADSAIPLYLYNFPALSGVVYSVDLVRRLSSLFGKRIAGLKDSSGDVEYARAIASLSTALAVFPSNEATFMQDRAGEFAGCISATANLTSELVARACRAGDNDAMTKAVRVRRLFDGKHLVPSIKAVLAKVLGVPALADVLSPFVKLSDTESIELFELYREALRG